MLLRSRLFFQCGEFFLFIVSCNVPHAPGGLLSFQATKRCVRLRSVSLPFIFQCRRGVVPILRREPVLCAGLHPHLWGQHRGRR